MSRCLSPALARKFDGLDGGGVAGASGNSERRHQLLSVCVQHQDLQPRNNAEDNSKNTFITHTRTVWSVKYDKREISKHPQTVSDLIFVSCFRRVFPL